MAVLVPVAGVSSVYTSTLWPTSLLKAASALPAPLSEGGCGCDGICCSMLHSYIVTPLARSRRARGVSIRHPTHYTMLARLCSQELTCACAIRFIKGVSRAIWAALVMATAHPETTSTGGGRCGTTRRFSHFRRRGHHAHDTQLGAIATARGAYGVSGSFSASSSPGDGECREPPGEQLAARA